MSEPVAPAPAATPVEAAPPRVPALRREAVLPREQRGGLGAVALLCSLAGVASGFALATTILATQIAQSETRMRRAPVHYREAPFLGIEYVNGPGNAAKITRIFPNAPAAAVGLAAGDHIVRFDGERLDQPWELGRLIRRSTIGHEPTLEVVRGDTTMILYPTLERGVVRDR